MPIRKTKTEFEEDAIIIHLGKYDYSEFEYLGSKIKSAIICPIHGVFYQRPNDHLRGIGCSKCSGKYSYTTGEFITEAKNIHGDRYTYDNFEYKNTSTKSTITCNLHGDFEQSADCHLRGVGCPKCAGTGKLSKEEFVTKATNIHGDKYDYSLFKYVNNATEGVIVCRDHGEFLQKANTHLSGHGCMKCGREGHWSKSDYVKKARGRICTFYTIRCFNEEESFYKIGITFNKTKDRYPRGVRMPYNYEIISEILGEAGEIWDLELSEKRKLKEFNYQPQISFNGSKTECFTNLDPNS